MRKPPDDTDMASKVYANRNETFPLYPTNHLHNDSGIRGLT